MNGLANIKNDPPIRKCPMKKECESKISGLVLFTVIIAIAILLIVGILSNYFSNFPAVRSTDQAVWGQFGDYFGGVLNPLLSFFALIGLMVTLRAQYAESKRSEKRHEEMTFDTRLFQLLTLSHSSVESVKLIQYIGDRKHDEFSGHRAIEYALNRLQEDYFSRAERVNAGQMYDKLVPEYASWKLIYWTAVASYVESMLFLIRYVIENAREEKNVEFSMRAVFAQMTSAEKLLLFYVMIFSPREKIIFSNILEAEYFSGAAKDDLFNYRKDLLHSAVLARLAMKNY